MNEQKIKQAYDLAVERYAAIGIDVEKVMDQFRSKFFGFNRSMDDATHFLQRRNNTCCHGLNHDRSEEQHV